ncbi:MAG: hypothetical protein KBA71_04705 [Opitutaceae bacterium]|nr:hypothetical protein [Opitutaceae bacterium]
MNLPPRAVAALGLLLGLGVTSLIAGPIQGPAIKYSIYDRDPDTGNGPIEFLSAGETYLSDFNLLEKGFDPLTMKITAARVTFAFADDNGDSGAEYATVWLGADKMVTVKNQEVDGNHTDAPLNYDYYYQEWSITNSSDLTFLTSLQSGILNYKVKSTTKNGVCGDFYLKIAQLEIDTECIVKAAESGSTALLLGFSILGMFWHRLRRSRTSSVA